ncbi:MAG: hypothetical protein H6Q60_975 [Oscillospiraceae bacterium]|nr:hypothetical protein [Oscillospiraceae bacterium]
MNPQNSSVRKIVMASMLATLTFVATRVIQIPLIGSGYVHLGDCFVLLSGWLMGPFYGAAAAGIGSMLADLLSPYAIYGPATLVIKALSAMLAAVTVAPFGRLFGRSDALARIASGISGGIVVPLGYFIFELWIFGFGVAIIDMPGIALKEVFGIVCAMLVFYALRKTKLIDRYFGG